MADEDFTEPPNIYSQDPAVIASRYTNRSPPSGDGNTAQFAKKAEARKRAKIAARPLGPTERRYIAAIQGDSKAAQRLLHDRTPTAGAHPLVLRLISAAAAGDLGEVTALLEDGEVDVNGQDGLGFSALFEAAFFGRVEVVKALIAAGANLNAQNGPGKETAVHGILDPSSRWFLRPFAEDVHGRAQVPVLVPAHLETVKMLLRYGTFWDYRRWDRLDIRGVASELRRQGGVPYLEEARVRPRWDTLQRIVEVVLNPPMSTRRAEPERWNPAVEALRGDKAEVCGHYRMRIQYHKNSASRHVCVPVGSFIYGGEGERNPELEKMERWARGHSYGPTRPEVQGRWWRWIHLPANNVGSGPYKAVVNAEGYWMIRARKLTMRALYTEAMGQGIFFQPL